MECRLCSLARAANPFRNRWLLKSIGSGSYSAEYLARWKNAAMTLLTELPGLPLSAADAFDVPVFVRRSTPLNPAANPTRQQLNEVHIPWPAMPGVPPDGDYLVSTTWRDVLKAAVTVGRDIAPWLIETPELACREILARRYPLAAYLVRQRASAGAGNGAAREVVPSVIYSHATENSTRSAFGYHVGMTMAEWACRGLMGLGPTTHAESSAPNGATIGWKSSKSLPDLFGTHRVTGDVWLVEAKGSRRLNGRARRKGATQLQVGQLFPVGHCKVLCATSLERRLFMAIDIEDRRPRPSSSSGDAAANPASTYGDEDLLVEHDDATLLALARAELLTYLALSSLSPNNLSLVAVGSPSRDRRRPGLVRLLESDEHTSDVRDRVQEGATGRQVRIREGTDMLIGALPGTDLLLGMSRRLFGACRSLAAAEFELFEEAGEAVYRIVMPGLRPYDLASVDDERAARWREELRPLRDTRAPELQRSAREGFSGRARHGHPDGLTAQRARGLLDRF